MSPNPISSKPSAHLDEWRVIRVREGARHLIGHVSGHPRLRDGARILTSALVALAADCSGAETMNTVYALGTHGEVPLPEEWAKRLDILLGDGCGTARVSEH